MSYALKRKNNYRILYSYDKKGFIINSANSSKYKISVCKITLVDKSLINYYITKMINKKFDKLFAKMYQLLTEEDENPSETPLILNEIEKLKRIVINKYKDYISEEVYKNIMKKLLIAEDEFKKDYNTKMYYRSLSYEESIGKSM